MRVVRLLILGGTWFVGRAVAEGFRIRNVGDLDIAVERAFGGRPALPKLIVSADRRP
jgi:hypothetical protein